MKMCNDRKNAKTIAEADSQYATIKAWWSSARAATDSDIHYLNTWLVWWHFRYKNWGNCMRQVSGRVHFLL